MLLGLLCVVVGLADSPSDAWATGERERIPAPPPREFEPSARTKAQAPLELPSFEFAHAREAELAAYVADRPLECCGETGRSSLFCHSTRARPQPLSDVPSQLAPEGVALHLRIVPTVRSRSPPSPARRG